MSMDQKLSPTTDDVEFPYRALSSTAIASIIFVALGGLAGYFFWPALGLSIIGLIAGWLSYRQIRRYPDEFEGLQMAIAGMTLNGLVILGCASMHTYIYVTEVPDGYTRLPFYELQQEASQSVDMPTQTAVEMNGKAVFLKGYIHPSSGSGVLKKFILVPDLGTCCFGGQPKSSDMVEVTLLGGQVTEAGLTKKKLAGEFSVNNAPRRVTDFDNNVFYRMKVDIIK